MLLQILKFFRKIKIYIDTDVILIFCDLTADKSGHKYVRAKCEIVKCGRRKQTFN